MKRLLRVRICFYKLLVIKLERNQRIAEIYKSHNYINFTKFTIIK